MDSIRGRIGVVAGGCARDLASQRTHVKMRIGPSKQKSWPAGYVLELIFACHEAELSHEVASEKVKAACHGNVTVSEFRRSLGLMPELRYGSEILQ
jgi:hypothetical protein